MSIQLNRNLAITLLFSLAILLALAPPSSANPDGLHRRDHVNLNRMLKIRAPFPPVPRQNPPAGHAGAVGGAANPSTDGVSSSSPSSTPVPAPLQPSSASPAPQPSSSLASSSSPATSSALPTSSQSSVISTSSATSTSTTSSLTSSTSSTHSTSSTPTSSTQGNKQLTFVDGPSASVDSVTLTSHVPAASSTGDAANSQIGGSSLSHSAITILIILAASIGGCGIIWTIIRKWKFRPSAQFEDRLEPVNWLPTEHESGLPTHRRVPSNASSFHSAGHENMVGLSRSDSGGGYTAGRSLTPLPEHDFTPGPANMAPVGGYADLARGPSPQPQMQEALQYGPTVNRGYENYLGPIPHIQGGLGVQEAYDHNDAGARY